MRQFRLKAATYSQTVDSEPSVYPRCQQLVLLKRQLLASLRVKQKQSICLQYNSTSTTSTIIYTTVRTVHAQNTRTQPANNNLSCYNWDCKHLMCHFCLADDISAPRVWWQESCFFFAGVSEGNFAHLNLFLQRFHLEGVRSGRLNLGSILSFANFYFS